MRSTGVLSITIAAATLFIAALATATGQQVSAASSRTGSTAVSNAVREIGDAATGDRWLLERDPAVPGGPGRLVRIAAGEEELPQAASGQSRSEKTSSFRVIRDGDKVVVEEHTAVMDAELEAVALSGARAGARLRVQLKIGGKIVSAVALGLGRVTTTPVTGARP
jgi:Chaperone for flagella basal body P-ring formation